MRHELGRAASARLSRRAALGGAAATIGVAATGVRFADAAPVSAGSSPIAGGPPLLPQDSVAVAPVPTTPGVRYWSVAGLDLKSAVSTQTFSTEEGQLFSASGGAFTAPLFLPQGARITELVSYVTRPNASTTTVRLAAHQSSNNNFQLMGTSNTSALPNPSALSALPMTFAPANPLAVVDNTTTAYFVVVDLPADAAHFIAGIRVGYVPPQGTQFFPITPCRVVDTRLAAFPGNGPLSPNSNRVFAIKDALTASGAVAATNLIPVGATAVSANITVSNPTGPNYLAVAPGDATGFTSSTINFPGGFDLANGANLTLDANRQIKVFCGDQGGSTHVIIDVNGYYAP